MPVGNLRKWKMVFSDSFRRPFLNSNVWQVYGGDQPPGDPGGWWNTDHTTVGRSLLDLRGYKDTSEGAPAGTWATAGLNQRAGRKYGKWEVRARMSNGAGIAPVLLLWPMSNNWPTDGEIDFAENGGQDPRSTSYMTVHYAGQCPSRDCWIQQSASVDWSRWHTYGVEWTPGKVVFTLDGKDVGAVTNHVPDVPMHLAIQDQMEGPSKCGGWAVCPNASTPAEVDFQVDWIVEYAPMR